MTAHGKAPIDGDVADAGGQARIVEFLSSPVAHGGDDVERIDTHISHVFLAPDRVYKLKRAVILPFLDFSTPEKRQAACENEIRVNRRYPSGLYRRVVPITDEGGNLALGGTGKPVDWAVEMNRFDENHDFASLVENSAVTGKQIDRLADMIAAQHEHEEPVCDPVRAISIPETIDGIARQIGDLAGTGVLHAALVLWRGKVEALSVQLSPRMEDRRLNGAVRPCHGDLHLGNICMNGDGPVPFDAMEFDDTVATCDVLYDLAFLLMDFVAHGRKDYANRLLNRYLGTTSDYGGLDLISLYISLRAAIRAMVFLMKGGRGAQERGETYLTFAADVLRAPCPAILIATGGLSGTGKSTLAASLAPRLPGPCGAVVLRTDVIRKRLAGVPLDRCMPAESHVKENSDAVYARLFELADRALTAGQPVLLDDAFLDPAEREHAKDLAFVHNATFRGFWLETGRRDILARRIAARPGHASDAAAATLDRQAAQVRRPLTWKRLDATSPLPRLQRACLESLTTWSAARWPSVTVQA